MYLILQSSRRLEPGYCSAFGMSLLWTVFEDFSYFLCDLPYSRSVMQKYDFPNASDLPSLLDFRSKLAHSFFPVILKWDVDCVCHVFLCFTDGLKPHTKTLISVASKKKSKAGKGDTTKGDESSKNDSAQTVTISLLFKRYVFDTQKKMIQSWESKSGLWLHLKHQTLKWSQLECVSCLNALDLFLPPSRALEVPADCVLPSEISAIWFCSYFVTFARWFFTVSLRTSLYHISTFGYTF